MQKQKRQENSLPAFAYKVVLKNALVIHNFTDIPILKKWNIYFSNALFSANNFCPFHH